MAKFLWGENKAQWPCYRLLKQLTKTLVPDGGSLLDVGGGVTCGCKYLANLSHFTEKVSVEFDGGHETISGAASAGIAVKFCDFRDYKLPKVFDLTLSLHVADLLRSGEFAEKVLSSGKLVIICSLGKVLQRVNHKPDAYFQKYTDKDLIELYKMQCKQDKRTHFLSVWGDWQAISKHYQSIFKN